MIKNLYQKPIKAFILLSGLTFPLFSYAWRSESDRAALRAEKEFRSYEWICNLEANDYDFIMGLSQLRKATAAYNFDIAFYYILLIGVPCFLFLAYIISDFSKKHSLSVGFWVLLLCLYGSAVVAGHQKIQQVTEPAKMEINKLRLSMSALDGVDSETIRICKPDRVNVSIKRLPETKSQDATQDNPSTSTIN